MRTFLGLPSSALRDVRRNQIVGMRLVELAPSRDASGLSTLTGIRLLSLAIKAMQRR